MSMRRMVSKLAKRSFRPKTCVHVIGELKVATVQQENLVNGNVVNSLAIFEGLGASIGSMFFLL